jgi:CAAX protease family protein
VLWPVLAAVLVLGTLLGLRAAPTHAWASRHAADVAALALLEAYAALLAVLLAVFGGPEGLRDRLGFRFTAWRHVAAALVTWLFSLMVGGLLTVALAPLFGPARSNAEDVLKVGHDLLFAAIVVPTVALLAPACEELLFRGVLYGWLRARLPVSAAAAVSAAIFAALHLLPPLLPVLFVFGVATALVYERTGSTLNSFAMHATQNTVAVVASYIALSGAATR